MLLELWKEALPQDSNVPHSYYEAKRLMRNLGLGYENIHVCKYDCILFWKEHKNVVVCPTCESRYKHDNDNGKKVPQKVLRYFPLKKRLQRLYLSRHTASAMKWHKDRRLNEEGVLRHPADGQLWKSFDEQFPDFASDSRNVRLGLATDGFNPFGNMSNAYSTWPVILVPYNLPPWKMMKQPYLIMSMLIPGPKAPGREIDVYLQPLIDELKYLWDEGVQAYDTDTNQIFQLRAAIIWTINDFPAYGCLSGWSTKGKMACPICLDDTSVISLRSKLGYIGHRRFLPKNHKFRRSDKYDGSRETCDPPKELSGEDVLEQLNCLHHVPFGKNPTCCGKRKRNAENLNWTKKSIFFELEYWSKLKLRHNLDVMHIEKNSCDSILGTLLNIEGKTKDTIKARLDLEDLCIRPELHLQAYQDKYYKPPTAYTLTVDGRKKFCSFIKSIKFPDGYAANISKNVNIKDGKLFGLKSHDCHVLLQRLIPIGMRSMVDNEIYTVLLELGVFFQKLCSRTLHEKDLDNMEKGIVLILCKLETIFPPAFFDIMVHLAVHLPREAKLAGPVASRWMYPIERYLGTLKKYVRNKARPEGCIVEGYMINEALTFCSMYLHGVETRFNREERNDDNGNDKYKMKLSIFSQQICTIGAHKVEVFDKKMVDKVHWYVLNNCEEVEPYLEEHKMVVPLELVGKEAESWQEKHFATWFKSRMGLLASTEDVDSMNDELKSLASPPDFRVIKYKACIVNGVRYQTTQRDRNKTTQNSGVMVLGSHSGEDLHFYGVLEDIIKLSFAGQFSVFLFKCTWFNNDPRKKRTIKDHDFICINITRKWYEDDPFILATQAQQIFYVADIKNGENWRIVQHVPQRNLWDIVEKTNIEHRVDEAYQSDSSLSATLNVKEHEIDGRLLSRTDTDGDEVSVPRFSNQPNQRDNLDNFIVEDNDDEMESSSMDEEDLILDDDSD